jgi:hypothetical protein
MPYKSDKKGILIPRELKRNIKLSPEDREEIKRIRRENVVSYQKIANAFGVSKRLVIFICNPEIAEKAKERLKEAKRQGKYYYKEKNTAAVRETRRYKHKLYKDGKLEQTEKAPDSQQVG